MRKTTFYCDRCGKQTTEIYQLGHRRVDTDNGFEIDHEWAAELCPECYKEIDDMIVHMIWHPEYKNPTNVISKTAKPKVAKNSRKLDLDLGKIAALHNAGWTNRKIAEEMKVSDVTISNRLQEALEFLHNNNNTLQEVDNDE